jgi:hypothetical protein
MPITITENNNGRELKTIWYSAEEIEKAFEYVDNQMRKDNTNWRLNPDILVDEAFKRVRERIGLKVK